MPSKTKLKNASSREVDIVAQESQGPMTAETIQDATIARKEALIERALGGELSYHLEVSFKLKRHP